MLIELFILYSRHLSYTHLNKYEKNEIYSVGQVGNIALNITKFDLGDTIFITYTSYKRPYKNFIKYAFSNSDTVYPNLEYLNKTAEAYDTSSGTTHNKDSRFWENTIKYYVYYYKIKIPNNNKTTFLLFDYDLNKNGIIRLEVENIIDPKIITLIMVITIPVGIILIALGILLIIFIKRIKRYCQRKYNLNSSRLNNDEDKDNLFENNLYPSSNNTPINEIETCNQKDEYPEKEEINNNNCATDEFIGGKPYYSENNSNGYPSIK